MTQNYEIKRVTYGWNWDEIPVLNMRYAYLDTRRVLPPLVRFV